MLNKYNVKALRFSPANDICADTDVMSKFIEYVKSSTNDKLYSFTIFVEYADNTPQYNIKWNVHTEERYNTIEIAHLQSTLQSVVVKEREHTRRFLVGFGQPSLEIICELFEPHFQWLATKYYKRWNKFYEKDDLYSIVKLCTCQLYAAGYYLNNKLLERTFVNYIYMELRKERNKPQILSYDAPALDDAEFAGDNKIVNFQDLFVDTDESDTREDTLDDEIRFQILYAMREEVLKIITPRQYDELLRIYRNNLTDGSISKKISDVRQKLINKGITKQSIEEKYYE